MCEFCEENNYDIAFENLDLGVIGDGYVELAVDPEKERMSLWVSFGDKPICVFIDINFCPMCGRRLLKNG